ncbi:MAG: ATP-binding cassette domain-containing protein, partial [Hyphomicrobiaceae bacterium]|nr:ATP-binding cassette domain-containing protein [Hyphomicrobiaceae bacterium]
MQKVTPLLDVQNLTVDIPTANGTLHAVRGSSFTLNRGEALGIVGESGSGKSMTALALMGLLPAKARRGASVLRLGQHDLLAMTDGDIARHVSGDRMSMIFQEPMT